MKESWVSLFNFATAFCNKRLWTLASALTNSLHVLCKGEVNAEEHPIGGKVVTATFFTPKSYKRFKFMVNWFTTESMRDWGICKTFKWERTSYIYSYWYIRIVITCIDHRSENVVSTQIVRIYSRTNSYIHICNVGKYEPHKSDVVQHKIRSHCQQERRWPQICGDVWVWTQTRRRVAEKSRSGWSCLVQQSHRAHQCLHVRNSFHIL